MNFRQSLFRFLGIVALYGCAASVQAQLNRGILEGIVTDPQGAVIPAVEVTVTAVDTNVSVPTKTNSAGYYRAVDLVPGKYRAHFVVSGFSPLDITDIQVPAGQIIRTDAQLRLGGTEQTVQVTAEAPLIETAATNFSTTVDTQTIQEIPLAGRDLQQLVFLVPGVVGAGPPGSNFGFNSQFGTFPDPTNLQGTNVAVNGGQGGANAWYLDGNVNLTALAETIVVNPSPDAVQEFQVISNAFSAEYGRTGGAVFNTVLKSGTNALHGSIYEFHRNDATNARNPFSSIDSQGHLIKDRQLRFNNFGGTVGGPVILPYLHNGKDKTFFFFSWEVSILHLLGNKTFTVPTPVMRQGEFSEDPNAALFGIWNPYTSKGPNSQGLFERTAFGTPVPGNPFGDQGCLNSSVEAGAANAIKTCNFATRLPSNGLDPVAMFFMNSFPQPNYFDPLSSCPSAGGGAFRICNNFLGGVGSSQNFHNISIKIDHQASDKSKYFVEWLFKPGKYNNYRVPWTGPTFPHIDVGWGGQYPLDFTNQIFGLGNTYTFSPTLINEFRGSFSRQFYTTNPETIGYPDSVTGLSAVEETLAPLRIPLGTASPAPWWPISTPGGFLSFGPTPWINNTSATEAYTIMDNLTKILGKHTLKTGFMYRLQHSAQSGSAPTYLGFYGGMVSDPTTGLGGGSGLAQFMLGAVQNDGSSFGTATWQPYFRWRYWGFYLQDDYHISPRFTLNLGLRYDIFGSYKTRQHPNARFCLECPNEDTGLKGKVLYEGDPGFPNNSDIIPPNWTDIGPRVNFSWAPFSNRKTVIRGGYDIFYSNAYESNNSQQSAPNGVGWAYDNYWRGSFYPDQCAPFSGQCVAWPLSDTTLDKAPLSTPPVTFTFPAQQRDPTYTYYMNSVFKAPRDPMVQTWTLEVQRELPGKIGVTVGYAGMHGTHLTGDTWHNYSHVPTSERLKYRTAINQIVPITDYYSGRTAQRLGEVWRSSVLPRGQLLTPYPFWPFVITTQPFDGTTVYHGFNLRVQKQYSHGLSFIAAYTASKKINSPQTGQLVITTVDPVHLYRAGYVGGRSGSTGYGGGLFGHGYQDPDNINADRALAPDDIPQMLNVAATYEFPFGNRKPFLNKKGTLNKLLGGWLLTGNFNTQSGVPLAISCPGNQLTSRCNLIGDPQFTGSRSKQERITQWINPAAFEPPFGSDQNFWANYDPTDDRAWRFGTAGSRLPGIRSPGFWNLDTALAKRFHIDEARYFEFRWEMFNALNHQSLGFPNTGFCLAPKPDGSTDLVHQAGCQFGRITNIQTDPRSMEFALKFYW